MEFLVSWCYINLIY